MHFKKENMLKPEVSKMHLDDKLSQIDIFVCKYLNSNIYPNFLYKDIEFFFYSLYHEKKNSIHCRILFRLYFIKNHQLFINIYWYSITKTLGFSARNSRAALECITQ